MIAAGGRPQAARCEMSCRTPFKPSPGGGRFIAEAEKRVNTEAAMNLKRFDDKCVRLTTTSGEVYEGVVSYCSEEFAAHEYGRSQEALLLTPILFYQDEIAGIVSLEHVNGPYGHFSEPYGLLETQCLAWGTDLMEEVFESDDEIQILRLLKCMEEHVHSLADRAVPGMAPWRSGSGTAESNDGDDGQGAVYLGELEHMLTMLAAHSANEEVVKSAKGLLARLAAPAFPAAEAPQA